MTAADEQTVAPAAGAHVVCAVDDLPVGEGRGFDVAGVPVAVFRPRTGPLRALSARCSHAGGPLADGQVDHAVVVCPMHQHVFDLDTGCSRTGQPAVATYPVAVVDGQVVVTVA